MLEGAVLARETMLVSSYPESLLSSVLGMILY